MAAINPDHILSAFYRVLSVDPTFSGLVTRIAKGPKRPTGYVNPAATISILTAPIGEGSNMIRGSAVVNVYADDYETGQANSDLLGDAAARIVELFHNTQPQYPTLRFHWVWAAEPLSPMESDKDGEHLASVRLMYAVSTAV